MKHSEIVAASFNKNNLTKNDPLHNHMLCGYVDNRDIRQAIAGHA